MSEINWEKIFVVVAQQLKENNREIFFEIIEDAPSPGGFYIAALSSSPSFAPDIQSQLAPGWIFKGWWNPDQRNNIGMIVWEDFK